MDQNNFDLSATSSGDLSVDAILAEYEATSGNAERPYAEPAAEPSRPIEMASQGDDAISSAGLSSRAQEEAPPLNAERSEASRPLSDLLSQIKSERGNVPENSVPPKVQSPAAGAGASLSFGEMMLMEDLSAENGEASPPVDMDDISGRPDNPRGSSRHRAGRGRRAKAARETDIPTESFSGAEQSEEAPTEPLTEREYRGEVPTEPFSGREYREEAPTEPFSGAELREEIPTEPVSESGFAEDFPTEPSITDKMRHSDATEAADGGADMSDFPTSSENIAVDAEPVPTFNSYFENKPSDPSTFEAEPGTLDGDNIGASELSDETDADEYAENGDYGQSPDRERRVPEGPDFKEKMLAPIIGIMAYSAAKREKRRAEAKARRDALPKEQPPELDPAKSAMLYAQQSDALKLRCIFASILTVILVYLSYGLPAPGLLGDSPTILALVCLIFELSVMVVGLDIFSNGILSLFSKRPGAESLIAVSAVITALDAVYIAATGDTELGLPFCGVSALSMTFALWGSKLNCDDFAISFYSAAQAENPSVVVSESGIDDEGCALAKIRRPVTGFVRTAETSDVFEDTSRLFAPVLIVAAIVLSAFSFFASSDCTNFIHTLAASLCICASLSALYGFSLPFSVVAKRLARSGVAIAGYSGCAELGRNRRVVITDADIFPPRTVSIGDISIAEGVSPQKVISYTGSMISAAGMGIAPVFTQLMRKNGCAMQKVEEFACHEGGGILARINGETVYVGTASFMRLMGVRIPDNAANRTTVYTAINDVLAGFFTLNYTAVASVQRALVSLLSGLGEPIFAIRDFNITPMLLKQKFRLPAGSYDFPSFADRYRISSPEYEESGTVAAMYSRGGLNSVAGLTKRGRRLYISLRFTAALSVLGSVVGMVLMLAMCWSGAYGSASCGNIMTYLLLWLVPVFVVSYGLRR